VDPVPSPARIRLTGPPPRLPQVVDRTVEGWWRLAPRVRVILVTAAMLAVAVAALLRVAAAPYGPPVPLLLAARDLSAGERPGAADVVAARWPRGLVPRDAVRGADQLVDATLAVPVMAGLPLVTGQLRGGGIAHGLAPSTAAVAVPAADLPGAGPGSLVDLVVTLGDGTGRRLAADVRVIIIEDGLAWLEVERTAAPDVAAAVARGTLSAVLLPP
jgi:pilus assembly protein CpaB